MPELNQGGFKMAGQSFSVINNLAARSAQTNLYSSQANMNKTLGRMSSGYRIVNAGDDAAGLAIANSLKADTTALAQASRNANDGIALIQIADGALSKMSDLLTRAVTLAEQAASDTVGTTEKATIDVEYQQILSEIDRVVSVVNFKGEALFSSGNAVTKNIFVGDTQFASSIKISIGASAKGAGTYALGLKNSDRSSVSNLQTADNAKWVLSQLKTAVASVSQWRGALGAQQNRLENSVSIIAVQSQNLSAAESTIRDANMAEEVVNMTKYQILTQSGMSALSQANASAQMVLSLLQ
jgi:flagellin